MDWHLTRHNITFNLNSWIDVEGPKLERENLAKPRSLRRKSQDASKLDP